MKKILKILPMFLIMSVLLTACGGSSDISVVSREDGSGTRGAFVEIIGLLEKNGDEEKDNTYEEAIIQNTTDGVLTTVEGDEYSIGYISTGSLNDRVKALAINGVRPIQENIKSGQYEISRPFLIGFKDNLNELEKDFVSYLLSQNAQSIVEKEGFIPVDSDYEYKASNLKGSFTISGSTSVTPIIEKLKENYEELNKDVSIEIQSNGSSTGINSTIDGTSVFAMSSRLLKEEEDQELETITLALDGIAVIVNKDNPLNDINLNDVKDIFSGKILDWEDIKK